MAATSNIRHCGGYALFPVLKWCFLFFHSTSFFNGSAITIFTRAGLWHGHANEPLRNHVQVHQYGRFVLNNPGILSNQSYKAFMQHAVYLLLIDL
jgi:hypothetical protein